MRCSRDVCLKKTTLRLALAIVLAAAVAQCRSPDTTSDPEAVRFTISGNAAKSDYRWLGPVPRGVDRRMSLIALQVKQSVPDVIFPEDSDPTSYPLCWYAVRIPSTYTNAHDIELLFDKTSDRYRLSDYSLTLEQMDPFVKRFEDKESAMNTVRGIIDAAINPKIVTGARDDDVMRALNNYVLTVGGKVPTEDSGAISCPHESRLRTIPEYFEKP